MSRELDVRRRSWLGELAGRVLDDRLPAGPVLATIAAACAERNTGTPARTPLLEGAHGEPIPWADLGPAPPGGLLGPDLVGEAAEVVTSPDERRGGGVHHTPRAVAERLVGAVVAAGSPPESICDPSVGGGAFLLAVARRLLSAGVPPPRLLDHLSGVDVEPLAVAAAETALSLLAAEHGVTVAPAGLMAHDALCLATKEFPRRPTDGYDLVIGNPPFGGQLRGPTRRSEAARAAARERWGSAAAVYTDRSALFLLLGLDLVGESGQVQMILPQSVLVARDAAALRRRVVSMGAVEAIWIDEPGTFVASVRVRAVTVRRNGVPSATTVSGGVAGHDTTVPSVEGGADDGWGSALAAAAGVPALELDGPPLRTLATATAGFRRQYYGLVPYVVEGEPALSADRVAPAPAGGGYPLVTVGLIDPAEHRWGREPCRFARSSWRAPVVDLESVEAGEPTLGAWVRDRLRPKVLVASQTRIVEAVVDADGALVPSVPVVSVEPLDGVDPWMIGVALLSPAASAWMVHRRAGSGLSGAVVRISARSVLDLPLPVDRAAWEEAATHLRRWHAEPADPAARSTFAAAAVVAHGVPSSERADLCSWWEGQVEPGARA